MVKMQSSFHKLKFSFEINSKQRRMLDELEENWDMDILEKIACAPNSMEYFQWIWKGGEIYTEKNIKNLPKGWKIVGSIKERGFSIKDIDITIPEETDKNEAVLIAKKLLKGLPFELRFGNKTKPFYDAIDDQWIE